MSQARYETAKLITDCTMPFSATKQFATERAVDFNTACPVGSMVIAKFAGGDNGHLPSEYLTAQTVAPAFAHAGQYGYVAMVSVVDDAGQQRLASVKCTRWAA